MLASPTRLGRLINRADDGGAERFQRDTAVLAPADELVDPDRGYNVVRALGRQKGNRAIPAAAPRPPVGGVPDQRSTRYARRVSSKDMARFIHRVLGQREVAVEGKAPYSTLKFLSAAQQVLIETTSQSISPGNGVR